jgi:hypothetical protein
LKIETDQKGNLAKKSGFWKDFRNNAIIGAIAVGVAISCFLGKVEKISATIQRSASLPNIRATSLQNVTLESLCSLEKNDIELCGNIAVYKITGARVPAIVLQSGFGSGYARKISAMLQRNCINALALGGSEVLVVVKKGFLKYGKELDLNKVIWDEEPLRIALQTLESSEEWAPSKDVLSEIVGALYSYVTIAKNSVEKVGSAEPIIGNESNAGAAITLLHNLMSTGLAEEDQIQFTRNLLRSLVRGTGIDIAMKRTLSREAIQLRLFPSTLIEITLDDIFSIINGRSSTPIDSIKSKLISNTITELFGLHSREILQIARTAVNKLADMHLLMCSLQIDAIKKCLAERIAECQKKGKSKDERKIEEILRQIDSFSGEKLEELMTKGFNEKWFAGFVSELISVEKDILQAELSSIGKLQPGDTKIMSDFLLHHESASGVLNGQTEKLINDITMHVIAEALGWIRYTLHTEVQAAILSNNPIKIKQLPEEDGHAESEKTLAIGEFYSLYSPCRSCWTLKWVNDRKSADKGFMFVYADNSVKDLYPTAGYLSGDLLLSRVGTKWTKWDVQP